PPPPPVGPSLPAVQTPAQTAAPPRFTGTPVSLDFQDADLRAVLRTFAEISSLNVVIDPSIQGTVDVALRDVPWDQALDIILGANRLGYVVDGTIVRIAPLTVLADEQAQRQKLAEAQALAGDLLTITRTLSYARAEQVQPLLTATVLSQRGSITTDVRTNTLIITDLADRLARAGDLVTTLDRPEPQVEIEARIVETTRAFARELGVQWGFNGRAAPELGNTLPLAFPNQVGLGGRMLGGTAGGAGGAAGGGGASGGSGTPAVAPGGQLTQGPTPADAASTAVSLGVLSATSGIGLALGSINGALNLDVALSALEEAGQGRLLSTPRVTTQNNIEAQITQGVQIPIQTVANNTVTVTFRDAALTLLVTPQITAVNTVIMKITVENAAPDYTRSVNNIPPIDTQRAVTQLLVNDGETTVIGGIYVSREQSQQARTPALYRIPLLGWLFQRNLIRDESRELLIFITPRIIRQ
ncbi:MAG: pilQ, partial [Acidobacteria bacterium]|nr:pilQ [Acidobacteriota bacterium]